MLFKNSDQYTIPSVLGVEVSKIVPPLLQRGCQASTVSRVGSVRVETGNQFVKRFHFVRADKAVPSPFARAFGFAPAVA